MRSITHILLMIALCIGIFVSRAASQDSISAAAQLYRIVLTDNTVVIGSITSEDAKMIHFRTISGVEISIPKSTIKKRTLATGGVVRGEFWHSDPNSTRMLFAPTARPLKQGQGYFSAYQIFFPFVAVGVTDFLSLAGGVSLFPGASSQVLYFAPKITPVNTEKFTLSGGMLYLSVPEEIEDAGIVYGVSSYGTENSSFTFGMGWGFSGGDFSNDPVLMFGAETRASNSVKFITENWIIPNSDVSFLSGGLRFFGESLAADFALILPVGDSLDGFPFFPWLGFAYNFGSSR